MQTITFPAFCSTGDGDSEYTDVDVDLTDEEVALLEEYGLQEDIYYDDFKNCEELDDIYRKVYSAAVEQITAELREAGWLDDEYADDPNWRADSVYTVGVEWPAYFEDLLPPID